MENLNQVVNFFIEVFNNIIAYWVNFSKKFTNLLDQLFDRANKAFGIDEAVFSVVLGIIFLLLSFVLIKFALIVIRDLKFSISYFFSRHKPEEEPILLTNVIKPDPLDNLLKMLSAFQDLLRNSKIIIICQVGEKKRAGILERLRLIESGLIEQTRIFFLGLPGKEKNLPEFPIGIADDAVLFANILVDSIDGDSTCSLKLKKDFEAIFQELIAWNKSVITMGSAKTGFAIDSRPIPCPVPA